MPRSVDIYNGVQRYESATVRAMMQEWVGRLRRKSVQLRSFEEVRAGLTVLQELDRGLQDIPVFQIVGSVGRHKDFTGNFLPTSAVSKERWSRIFAETVGETGLPPVEVYQVGDEYYVRDGHHRISVARDMGFKTIQAYVTEVKHQSLGVNDELDGASQSSDEGN